MDQRKWRSRKARRGTLYVQYLGFCQHLDRPGSSEKQTGFDGQLSENLFSLKLCLRKPLTSRRWQSRGASSVDLNNPGDFSMQIGSGGNLSKKILDLSMQASGAAVHPPAPRCWLGPGARGRDQIWLLKNMTGKSENPEHPKMKNGEPRIFLFLKIRLVKIWLVIRGNNY